MALMGCGGVGWGRGELLGWAHMNTPGAISFFPAGGAGAGAAQGGMVHGALGPAAQSQRHDPLQQCWPLGHPSLGVP